MQPDQDNIEDLLGGLNILLTINVEPQGIFNNLHDLIRMAFPEYELREGRPDRASDRIVLSFADAGDGFRADGSIAINGKTTGWQDFEPGPEGLEPSAAFRRRARRFTYNLLCRHLGINFNAYGILTGVRPVKIVHRLIDQGLDDAAIKERLEKEYLIRPEKADLLLEVAGCSRPFLLPADEARRRLSVYIGIPFCPSRCYYCSFPGAVLTDYERDMKPYLQALLREMNHIGDYLVRSGWQVETIYIGGGTPTVVTDSDLDQIFNVLYGKFISASTAEITVEAGRPDTLFPERLQWLHQAGVNRVCINPQTMHDDTLRLIGRGHNAGMAADAVGWARSAGIEHVNMDLIVGLPGENKEYVAESIQEVLKLKPDNITVHTLAVKRGSMMAAAQGKAHRRESIAGAEEGMTCCDRLIRQHGYRPYYLYRQKYMQAGLENTGYTLPGCVCRYNVQMIEERQTIVGLGGGAGSKFVDAADWSLTSLHNPKEPGSYIKTVENLSTRKVDKLRALN